MSLFLDEIEKLNYKEEWLKMIFSDNLVTYFFNVDANIRSHLEHYYIFFKDYNCEFLDGNDMVILSYIEVKINDLLQESLNRVLSLSEINFLSRMLGGMILYNKKVSDDKIVCYVNNCYLNNKNAGLSSDLPILLRYTFNYLNNFNWSDISFRLRPSEVMGGDFGKFSLNCNTRKEYLFIDNDYYNSNFIADTGVISLEEFSYIFIFQTVILLHEFRHYMQYKLRFRDAVVNCEERIQKELEIILNNRSFYNKYYESFFIEIDAFQYASSNLDYIIDGFVLDDYYDETMTSVLLEFEKNISDFNIDKLVDEEYKKYVKKR